MTDQLHRFHFQQAPVRGHWVDITSTMARIDAAQNPPAPVRNALAEMVAVVSMLAHDIKFEGSVMLQSRGDGPLHTAMAECRDKRWLRAIARSTDLAEDRPFAELIGNGQLAISLIPKDGDIYQGMVGLDHPTLSENIETYFATSEQLQTRVRVVTTPTRTVGCFLQRLPTNPESNEIEEEADDEGWQRVTLLFETTKDRELLELSPTQFLKRLFPTDPIFLDDALPLEFRCTCSREKSVKILQTLNREEIDEALKSDGFLEVVCEFCESRHRFSGVEIDTAIEGRRPPVH